MYLFLYKHVSKATGSGGCRTSRFLEHMSVKIDKGDCIALTGHSGCGKSTFLKLLMNLYAIDEGKIIVKLLEKEETLSAAWRHLYAYVPQGNQLMTGTIRDTVTFGDEDEQQESKIWEALQIADAVDFVKALPNGLNTHLGERGSGSFGRTDAADCDCKGNLFTGTDIIIG